MLLFLGERYAVRRELAVLYRQSTKDQRTRLLEQFQMQPGDNQSFAV